MKRTSRAPFKLSESVHHQLNMYTLAAGAAGVGVLALVQPSEAKIVYTPAHKWIPLNHPVHFDLNHDGLTDFTLYLRGSFRFAFDFYVRGSPANRAVSVISNNAVCVAALPRGAKVGPKSPWGSSPIGDLFFIVSETNGSTFSGCPWRFVAGEGYLGVRFEIKGQTHYGWLRVGHVRPREGPKAEVTGYAYETIPGKPIIAGATKGPDAAEPTASLNTHNPEPATLGVLAMGAPGLSIWRRKERAESTQ
jgi:hypothetical protein